MRGLVVPELHKRLIVGVYLARSDPIEESWRHQILKQVSMHLKTIIGGLEVQMHVWQQPREDVDNKVCSVKLFRMS